MCHHSWLMCDFVQQGVLDVKGRKGVEGGLIWRKCAHIWVAVQVTGEDYGSGNSTVFPYGLET